MYFKGHTHQNYRYWFYLYKQIGTPSHITYRSSSTGGSSSQRVLPKLTRVWLSSPVCRWWPLRVTVVPPASGPKVGSMDINWGSWNILQLHQTTCPWKLVPVNMLVDMRKILNFLLAKISVGTISYHKKMFLYEIELIAYISF